MADPTAIRLVWRLADMQVPEWPGLAVTACGRCRAPVYIDTGQIVPRAIAAAELVCVPCALNDDELRPEVLKIYRSVRAASSMADPRLVL